MIKYRTQLDRIEKVEVVKESEYSVWFPDGKRAKKGTSYECYFDTWADAHTYLMDEAAKKVSKHVSWLEQVEKSYAEIKGLMEIES